MKKPKKIKPVKAWGVWDGRGYQICGVSRETARGWVDEENGERVVRVEIREVVK